MWFYLDDWDFLVDRRAGDLGDLLRAHNGHWVTLPVLLYRFLWWTVGLRSYQAYQVFAVLTYLLGAFLLRMVMRRAGVRPWTATFAAGLLVLYGTAYQDMLHAFQVSLNASLVFGLTHVLLADHDGPLDRRDWLGLAAGAAGLMCSAVGVTMVFAAGLAVLLRRGWKLALVHTVPLAVMFVVWWTTIGNDEPRRTATFGEVRRFVLDTIGATFRDIGRVPAVGVLVAAVLVAGAVIVLRPRGVRNALRRYALPTALLAGVPVFVLATAVARAGMANLSLRSRYEHLAFALMLPALAVAADALMKWRRVLTIPVIAILVIGVPGNVRAVVDYSRSDNVQRMAAYRRMIETLPRVPVAQQTPPDLVPESLTGFRVTMGWLLDGAASGRIPAPAHLDPDEVAFATLRLSVAQEKTPAPRTGCRPVAFGLLIALEPGEGVNLIGVTMNKIVLVPEPVGEVRGRGISFHPNFGRTLRALQPAKFRLTTRGRNNARVCATAPVLQRMQDLR
jgi:hypothetical protein